MVVAPNVLADAIGGEAYEGCRVRVENVQVTVAPDQYGALRVQAVPVDANPADDLYVDDQMYTISPAPAVGATYASITGLLDYSHSAFRLQPRGDTDLVVP
jgi:hypothetical protein